MMSDLWSLVCLVGLWGWVLSACLLLAKAFPSRGVFLARPALVWGGAFAVCYALWLAGMSHA